MAYSFRLLLLPTMLKGSYFRYSKTIISFQRTRYSSIGLKLWRSSFFLAN